MYARQPPDTLIFEAISTFRSPSLSHGLKRSFCWRKNRAVAMAPDVPQIIAHRGASKHAPENTLAALSAALDLGADGVEFDVQLAKDGVPVVIHDYDLKRTAGRAECVADLTSKQ